MSSRVWRGLRFAVRLQLRFERFEEGGVYLAGDTDGDKIPDVYITSADIDRLKASDFVL